MNRAQAELKAFEKRYGIAELNRSKNKGTGEVDDRVLKEWAAKTKAYGDANKAADTKQKMVWDRAEQRGGMDEQGKAELRGFGRDSDRIQITRDINKPDNTADNTYRSADFQARSEDNARRQNRQQQKQARQDFAHSEDRRRQAIANRPGPVRQSTRDLSGQDRRFNERVAGYGQARGQRGGQGSRGMQERSEKGRRYGKLSGGGQRPGGRTPTLRDSFIEKYGNRPSQMATYESANDPRYGNAPTKEEQRWIDKGNIIRKDRNPRGWTPTHRGQNGGGQRGGGRSPIRAGGRPLSLGELKRPMSGGGRS